MKEFRTAIMPELLTEYNESSILENHFNDRDTQLLMAFERDVLDLEASKIRNDNRPTDLDRWRKTFNEKYAPFLEGTWKLKDPLSFGQLRKQLTARIENQDALKKYLYDRLNILSTSTVGKAYKEKIDKIDEDDLKMLHYDGSRESDV